MLSIEKIERIKKESNVYTVSLTDGQTYDIWDELMIQYKLSVGKAFKPESLKEAVLETQYYKGKYSILKYLGNKNRSMKEIETYLKKKDYDSDIIDRIKDFLVENNLVNDEFLAENYIQEAVSKGYGALKIKYELEKRGIVIKAIEEKISQYLPKDQEREKAQQIFEARLNGQVPNQKNCAKIARYLASKGYDMEMICEIITKME